MKASLLVLCVVSVKACLPYQNGDDGITTATNEPFSGMAWQDSDNDGWWDSNESAIGLETFQIHHRNHSGLGSSPPAPVFMGAVVSGSGGAGGTLGAFSKNITYPSGRLHVWTFSHPATGWAVQHSRQRVPELASKTPNQALRICIDYDNRQTHYANFRFAKQASLDTSTLPFWQQVAVEVGWETLVEQEVVATIQERIASRTGVTVPVLMPSSGDRRCDSLPPPRVIVRMTQTAGDLYPAFAFGSTYFGKDDFNSWTDDLVEIYTRKHTLGSSVFWDWHWRWENPMLRVRELGRAIGNTSVHEIGHTWGLVSPFVLSGTAPDWHHDSAGFVIPSWRSVPGEYMASETSIGELAEVGVYPDTPRRPGDNGWLTFPGLARRHNRLELSYLEYMP
ncbi:MAG: hypothetical protein AB1730_23030 [Myxococcota bacterium]